MKSYEMLISVFLIFCLVSLVWAAPENTTTSNNTTTAINFIPPWAGGDGGHHGGNANKVDQSTVVIPSKQVKGMTGTVVASAETFTSTPTTGKCLDNKKKVAVYMAAMTNPVVSETLTTDPDNPVDQYIPVVYDPLATAMFFEYNPDYLGDSNIASRLTTANYELLIVPMPEMSTPAASAISTYISNGGSVWFLNDPCMTPTYTSNVQLINILGPVSSPTPSISSSTTITVVNNDSITNGLSTSFKPVGTTAKDTVCRSLSGSGTIAGFSYQVLMSSGSNALLVKFENQTSGARVIYSNPNMFISGGTSSYFNAQTATKLFTQTKAWIMKFAQNPSVLQITYPGGDKQLTVTIDDMMCADPSWNPRITMLFDNETSAGITPNKVNTFYVIPNPDFNQIEAKYYEGYGDMHTIHAHQYYNNTTNQWYDSNWDINSTSVATYDKNISSLKQFYNTVMGASNYGFTSWRFPMTTYCANSMQAVSDSGFTIDSSNGGDSSNNVWIGDGFQVGNQQDNTLFFPEQILVNNAKTNTIEFPLNGIFDVDCETSNQYFNAYNLYTNQLTNVNFPANFIIGGHYQGIGTDGTVWPVTVKGLPAELKQILVAEKAANPNYATVNTLAGYINGIKSATIAATYDGTSTTVTVTNPTTINGFTIKADAGNVKSATCNNTPVTIKSDSLTGAKYITSDLSAGSHAFVITSNVTYVLPVANFSSNVTSGYAPLTVNFNDTSKNATGWKWDFGDGTNSTQQNVTHVYTATGNFVVNLTASNANGTDMKSTTINVNKVSPTITWNNPVNITYGTPLSSTQLNATASVPGTFNYTPPSGTVLSMGNNQTLRVDFTPNDTTNYTTVSTNVTINITGIPVFPGYTNPPTDPDHDGLYEDVNGNGQLDFDDVVVYSDNLEWIRQQGLIANFDYDNSGSIDYNDVLKLYGMI